MDFDIVVGALTFDTHTMTSETITYCYNVSETIITYSFHLNHEGSVEHHVLWQDSLQSYDLILILKEY